MFRKLQNYMSGKSGADIALLLIFHNGATYFKISLNHYSIYMTKHVFSRFFYKVLYGFLFFVAVRSSLINKDNKVFIRS